MKYLLAIPALSFLGILPAAAQQVPDRDRHDALRHYRSGEQALSQEKFDVAEREFQQAAKLDPLLELAPYGLGQVYMATKQYPAAVGAYSKARGIFQANAANALRDEGTRQQRIRDQITALEDLRNAYATGRIVATSNGAGRIQTLEMQISQLRFQSHRHPDQPEPVPAWISIALGSAYFRDSQMADAEREYRAALEVEPKLGEAHNNLAVVLMLTRRYPDASEEVKAAESAGFKVNPQFKDDLKKAMAAR